MRRPISNRQKMINLMYLVLMAMLAINVSSDVLDGFSLVDEGLNRSKENASSQNDAIYQTIADAMERNPEKTREWYDKAQYVRNLSDSLYSLAESLKWEIVREADGRDGNIHDIVNRENLEAATHVMLSPTTGRGQELFEAINRYRETVTAMAGDEQMRSIITANLSTKVPKKVTTLGRNWQEYMFENTPVIAAVTLLSKLQNDVRSAEGEILHQLVANIDMKDVRVNEINAFVIPNAQTVVRGNRFTADIVMAAVDTTARPDIYIGNTLLRNSNGHYETVCNATGDFTLRGYLVMKNKDGEEIRRNFSRQYTVVEPTATVSADLMNVLYAGYDNPISISVPGVPQTAISATMTNGTLRQTSAGHYIAKPARVGEKVDITVFSNHSGTSQQMAMFSFQVRKLPEPAPYISITDEAGNSDYYRGGSIGKSQLLSATRIEAAVDDGILHIPFRVLGFEMVFFDNMGNAVPVNSDGAGISAQQKETVRKLSRGKRFYISRLTAIGPDGIERKLNTSMEVIIR